MKTLMNPAAVDAATEQVLAQDIRVLNGSLYAPDEAGHVAVLLAALAPQQGARVIDAGCGLGEMARLMAQARPDLDFLLVNSSQAQLDLCPAQFDRLRCDFHDMPLVDGCADAIVFSYSLCHSPDWPAALREARRVLRDGGVLLVNDMARVAGDNAELERVLGARAQAPEDVIDWAARAGFRLDSAQAPVAVVDRLADVLVQDGVSPSMLDDCVPMVWRFIAVPADEARWLRHRGRVGFQFSGGRDSTAALYLLRARWPDMTVYHLDTGDQFPETGDIVRRVREDVEAAGGAFITVTTDVKAYRATVGWPSDIVPTFNTPLGRRVSGEAQPLVDRYQCCWDNLMWPMYERMRADGITLLVRGTRDDEFAAPVLRDGDVADGVEAHYPIGGWTAAQVDAYLAAEGLPVAPYYARGLTRAPECMGCTAWLDEGRLRYMRDHHPKHWGSVVERLETINDEVGRAVHWLKHEMEA
ncbi:methyltransferase domain-containing protein [Xenophilus sp. Marseille-Q4582]|uniref:methyltransferase domain-containing protein n=1 Tax=Xenophilus sp. Marseille-Q4582 TaxID=2866600 RepID=UPI001CE3EE69|nr:methyltransferase domain-containing protein [Xenophilus sp. Marseille-Q4582]